MRTASVVLFALVVIATPASAKVTIDYAHDYDFSAVKTFTYVETSETNAASQLDDERIASAVVRHLTEGGLEQVESGGDIAVTYHVATEDNTVYNTSTFGYGGWGPGWGAWGGTGMGSATTTESTYTQGTLVIDAYDSETKDLVWRGTATDTVKDNPEKRAKQIDNALDDLGKKWHKILKNQGE